MLNDASPSDDRHSCYLNRRHFLAAAGLAGLATVAPYGMIANAGTATARKTFERARVRAAFLYPPSATFFDNPDGWWSWPGNEYDAEARQKQYTKELAQRADALGIDIMMDASSIGTDEQVQQLAAEIEAAPPDAVLLIMFYNNSIKHADALLAAAEKLAVPAIFYIGLGVKHGPITQYRRPGVHFVQAMDDFGALERALRMVAAKKRMSQSRILSITEAGGVSESVEPFLGVTVRVIPFAQYAAAHQDATLDDPTHRWMKHLARKAKEVRGVTPEALDNAARAHVALKQLLREEDADGVTMNCLRRGMLKPCISFATLNGELTPAACENDLPAVYTQLMGQLLLGRPGFQHNPAYETERNHYYASHCTCSPQLRGPDADGLPYLLRRFAHTNEGSCAIQVFWEADEPVTMVRYYPGEEPALDVYAGKVVASHPMPPAAGCTTNVEIELTDRSDACMVKGHHNLLFCGDYARDFRDFARLYRIRLAETGYGGAV